MVCCALNRINSSGSSINIGSALSHSTLHWFINCLCTRNSSRTMSVHNQNNSSPSSWTTVQVNKVKMPCFITAAWNMWTDKVKMVEIIKWTRCCIFLILNYDNWIYTMFVCWQLRWVLEQSWKVTGRPTHHKPDGVPLPLWCFMWFPLMKTEIQITFSSTSIVCLKAFQ